jgi:hypothetical protein
MQINGEILRGNVPRGTDHDLCARGIHHLSRRAELGVAHPPRHEYYLPPRVGRFLFPGSREPAPPHPAAAVPALFRPDGGGGGLPHALGLGRGRRSEHRLGVWQRQYSRKVVHAEVTLHSVLHDRLKKAVVPARRVLRVALAPPTAAVGPHARVPHLGGDLADAPLSAVVLANYGTSHPLKVVERPQLVGQ